MDPYLQQALLVHVGLTALAIWPALRLLGRAGLPKAWAATLAVPILGWAIFVGLLALKQWPTLPPRPERLHPRERLRHERVRAEAGATSGTGT